MAIKYRMVQRIKPDGTLEMISIGLPESKWKEIEDQARDLKNKSMDTGEVIVTANQQPKKTNVNEKEAMNKLDFQKEIDKINDKYERKQKRLERMTIIMMLLWIMVFIMLVIWSNANSIPTTR